MAKKPEPAARGLAPSGFGPELRRLREGRGLTQKQVGDAAGVHPNSIAKMERSEIEPSWPMVLALAKALGVDCAAFTTPSAGAPMENAAPRDASLERAARLVAVSADVVEKASRVLKEGTPELFRAVEDGWLELDEAIGLLSLTRDNQLKAVAALKPVAKKGGKK